jgi:SAM-dependent methyltransferase
MLKFVLGSNYVGPLADVLAPQCNVNRRILDCGTGSGKWAIEMADEFSWTQVIGVDLAPIQPRDVPPNCTFELFDLDGQRLPYPDGWFDVVHCRSIYTGIRNYQMFLREVARVLRPGGIVILAESDSSPMTDNKRPIPAGPNGAGWRSFWTHYRQALIQQGIDVVIPTRLKHHLKETRAFDHIVAQEALVPIGFWPKDPVILTIGQLAWMNYDNFLTAVRPFFHHYGLSEEEVDKVIEDAQQDLYFPRIRPSACWHIVHAQKGPGRRYR